LYKTRVKKMDVFWAVSPCTHTDVSVVIAACHQNYLLPDDGGGRHLSNVCERLPDYTPQ
jgi:hypothetical protein